MGSVIKKRRKRMAKNETVKQIIKAVQEGDGETIDWDSFYIPQWLLNDPAMLSRMETMARQDCMLGLMRARTFVCNAM